MPLQPFQNFRPDLAFEECRFLSFEGEDDGNSIPAGQFAFMEWYCDEPDCDCRRMLLTVMQPDNPEPLATISYGFDRSSEMAGPFLDPFLPQSDYAEEMLEFARDVLLTDPNYVARCQRHYQMVKECVGGGRVKTLTKSLTREEAQARIGVLKAQRKQRRAEEKRASGRKRPR